MRSVGKPLLDHQAEMPLPAVNSLFDGSIRRACSGTGAPTSSRS